MGLAMQWSLLQQLIASNACCTTAVDGPMFGSKSFHKLERKGKKWNGSTLCAGGTGWKYGIAISYGNGLYCTGKDLNGM